MLAMRARARGTSRAKGHRITGAPVSAAGGDRAADIMPNILPLPWPVDGISVREARRPHAHRCISCASDYRCGGPDQSGECAPVCDPCMWVELGSQLRMYRTMADTIERRRRKIESEVGTGACRKAQDNRRNLMLNRNVIAGFGQMVLTRGDTDSANDRIESDYSRINPSGEGY